MHNLFFKTGRTLNAAIGLENRYRQTRPLNKREKKICQSGKTESTHKNQNKTVMLGVTYFLKEVQSIQEQLQLDMGVCVPSLKLSTVEEK